MSAVIMRQPIKLLSPQLADQIAAGEVIERPSSVLKELIENALDAHATRIDIDLAAGGIERIRVTDNGEGIIASELPLAVSRHATSKLTSIQDLLQLQTLGFRGEALASICSVSQWQVISCIDIETQACKLSSVNPTQPHADHHPRGTTVQIEKLFHNTPARRKFLRAERTEFRHCDDVIRRVALARFDVAFYVKHNARQIHRLPAVKDDIGRTRRVTQLCGEQFIRESLAIDYAHEGMRVWGWISTPDYSRQQTDLQYFYINGRVIRDRMINHAIRFAYQDVLPTGRQPAYVLHLEIEPDRFDVNVHPTKQEVRFRETRMVHDFLSRSLRQALHSGPNRLTNVATATNHPVSHYRYEIDQDGVQEMAGEYKSVTEAHSDLLFGRYIFCQQHDKVLLIDLQIACAHLTSERWYQQLLADAVKQHPLLIPLRFKLDAKLCVQFEEKQSLLAKLGFDVTLITVDEVVLRFMPAVLSAYQSVQDIALALLAQDAHDAGQEILFSLLVDKSLNMNKVDINQITQTMQMQVQTYQDCCREVTETDIAHLFREFR